MTYGQDLPLKTDIAAHFVPKIVALIVYLGALCFVFTLFMIHSTQLWEKQITTHFSIEIPTLPGESSQSTQSSILQLLTRTPGIQKATVVPQKETENLLHSLLGEEVNLDQFSLPIIIDVSLNGKEKVDPRTLSIHLKNISPFIQLIDHQNWQSQVSNLIHTGVLMALMISLLILSAALIATTFATRTSLLIHRQVVEVLNLIGATHTYIAKQFQRHAFKQGLIASSIGSFFAFLTFIGIAALLEKTGFSLEINASFFFQALIIFILTPFLTAGSMMLSARWAVMKALRS